MAAATVAAPLAAARLGQLSRAGPPAAGCRRPCLHIAASPPLPAQRLRTTGSLPRRGASLHHAPRRLAPRQLVRASSGGPPQPDKEAEAQTLVIVYGSGAVLTLLATTFFVLGQDYWLGSEENFYEPAANLGDYLGAALWSVSLFFASPYQLLLLFLGKIETERPSDWTLRLLGKAAGLNVDAVEYEAPTALRVANGGVFLLSGAAVAVALSSALGGEATWSVSTGLGSCLAAGVYELGRPRRLSVDEQVALEARWKEFKSFADEKLERKGRCHVSDVDKALRGFYPALRRAAEPEMTARARRRAGLPEKSVTEVGPFAEKELREMIANWHPGAERSGSGFYKNLSVRVEEGSPKTDPFTGQPVARP